MHSLAWCHVAVLLECCLNYSIMSTCVYPGTFPGEGLPGLTFHSAISFFFHILICQKTSAILFLKKSPFFSPYLPPHKTLGNDKISCICFLFVCFCETSKNSCIHLWKCQEQLYLFMKGASKVFPGKGKLGKGESVILVMVRRTEAEWHLPILAYVTPTPDPPGSIHIALIL